MGKLLSVAIKGCRGVMLTVAEDGGSVNTYDRNGKLSAALSSGIFGGSVMTFGNDLNRTRKMMASLGIFKHGGGCDCIWQGREVGSIARHI